MRVINFNMNWTVHGSIDSGWWTEVKGKNCTITIEPRPNYCDRGNWVAKITEFDGPLRLDLDDQDGWPRYYFDLGRAKLEVEAWLVKRGQAL